MKEKQDTQCVREPRFEMQAGPVNCPIIQSTTFELESTAQGFGFVESKNPSSLYTRWGNPTVAVWEKYVAKLEGGEKALAFSSGMAAISTTLMTFLKPGDHIVAYKTLYSATMEFINRYLKSYGITATFVDTTDIKDFENAITDNTKVIYAETPDNPNLSIIDLSKIAELAKKNSLVSICDSTFATPICQNPLSLGIDVVVHSATKYLGGHSDVIAGVAVANTEKMDEIWELAKLLGGCMDPHAAWLLIRGSKTLSVRMNKQCANAMEIAEFLEEHPAIEKVIYPGLASHPQHEIAKKQMGGLFGGMISFLVKGGKEAAQKVSESTDIITLAVSLGGVESLIEHPATLTHATLTEDELKTAGIEPGLLRLSVGIENPQDLIEDLKTALKSVNQ